MSYCKLASDENLRAKNLVSLVRYNRDFKKTHKGYFDPDGLLVFTGMQGSGKTLSAVKYVCKVMELYPDCILVTNIEIKSYPFDNRRVFIFRNADDLTKFNNGEKGVLYFIDEIQLYFNSLESKNISMDIMTEISQQRKQRKHIVATSQVFGRLAKPLREQFNTVVTCKKIFNCLQINKYISAEDVKLDNDQMHITASKCKRSIFFYSPKDFMNYDTYFKVKNLKIADIKGGQEIYERNTIKFNRDDVCTDNK
jgi:hypothetical protein